MLGAGLEPARISPHAPQACVSANFTTRADRFLLKTRDIIPQPSPVAQGGILKIEKIAKTPLRKQARYDTMLGVFRYGEVAQLVEHHVRNVGVESSNLFFSTKSREKTRRDFSYDRGSLFFSVVPNLEMTEPSWRRGSLRTRGKAKNARKGQNKKLWISPKFPNGCLAGTRTPTSRIRICGATITPRGNLVCPLRTGGVDGARTRNPRIDSPVR